MSIIELVKTIVTRCFVVVYVLQNVSQSIVHLDESCSVEMEALVVTDCVIDNKTQSQQLRGYGRVSQHSNCESNGPFHVEIN